ncbi:signal peptidase [Chryseobacterium luquanense]|uniref:Signal peptidase n=1 Tax=Chryseobacterium luquanense TaxID=2983766 RepID=A0ABT3Y6U8_9FLAO|nr:signal peptidase [Chryseobacterium luquanense]MCX8533877.1 signal peptidase [Chryseobacterium luquanense]
MKFIIKKVFPILLIIAFGLINAQNTPGSGPCGFGSFPPCAPAASPIDMYVYILAIIAIITIAFFAKKYKTQKI